MPEERFLVSARKYRPDTFDTVIGQATVTNTLRRQIEQQRIAHAYLFCGPRGVGKTTCARIFAKAINCSNRTPEGDPCNECQSCLDANSGHGRDVFEFDAASNNKTEDIRKLIDQVNGNTPLFGKYCVYIIDEVHMLTTQAFNTFLKTLEEPPSYVVFIFATTEKHKVLPTILSRCQIYDFNRIQVNDTIDALAAIAEKEHVEYERDALNLIALKADGAMRDALSIFDQVVSFSEAHVTRAQVVEGLNLLDLNIYFSLSDAVLAKDSMRALTLLNEVIQKGFGLANFLSGFTVHFRNLILASNPAGIALLDVGNELGAQYQAHASAEFNPVFFHCLELCMDAESTLRYSANQRLHVELLLLSLCESSDNEKKKRLINRNWLSRAIVLSINAKQVESKKVETPTAAPKPVSATPQGYSIKQTPPAAISQRGQIPELPERQKVALTPQNLAEVWEEVKKMLFGTRWHLFVDNCEPEVKSDSEIYFAFLHPSVEKSFEEQREYLVRNLSRRFTVENLTIYGALDPVKIKERERRELRSEEVIFEVVKEENPELAAFLAQL